MKLPATGTGALLEKLDPFVPDDLINTLFRQRSGRGRRALLSPSQMFRVTLLVLLTPAHSFNLLVKLLPEHRTWRSFARLRNRFDLPDARMLHDFRDGLEVMKLRQVNNHLLQPLLAGTHRFAKTVALIDSTDLPAATNPYKKMLSVNIRRAGLRSAGVVAKTDKVAGSLATKSIRSDSGFVSTHPTFC